MSNPIDIRVPGTFEIKVFVFIVINKVMHIMNIFVRNYQKHLMLFLWSAHLKNDARFVICS